MQLFCSNPNRAFYVREITRKIDEQINSVRRELANLLSIGIISSETNNNRLYYEVNQKYEHYKALAAMFGGGVVGTEKEAPTVATTQYQEIHNLGNVELALYTGQFTRDETSGIDLLVVGDINQTKLSKYIDELEKQEGKEIRYAVMLPHEFSYRRQVNDRFLSLVLDSKIQVLIDKNEMFIKVPESPSPKSKLDKKAKTEKEE